MKSHHIAILTSYAGSVVSFRGELIRLLVLRGYRVTVLAPDLNGHIQEELSLLGAASQHYPLKRTGLSPIADFTSLLFLFRLFIKLRPSILLTYFVKPNIWGTLAAAFAGVPRKVAIIEGLGYYFTYIPNSVRFGRQFFLRYIISVLYSLSFLFADRIIFLNVDDMRDLRLSSAIPDHKLFLLGGIGVSLSEWSLCEPCTEPLVFVMVGRLLREKGVFDFLAAAKLIKSEFPSARFLLLGGEDSSPGSISICELQPWFDTGIVEYLGHSDVRYWLSRASVFVLPSYREGVPRSAQEAMALGLPIITTDVPGCRETVVDGANGFLVPVNSPIRLASAMREFLLCPQRVVRMGAESRRIAEGKFDITKQSLRLLHALTDE